VAGAALVVALAPALLARAVLPGVAHGECDQYVVPLTRPALLSIALLASSVVTLPHALLVTLGLDAARWRQQADLRSAALITSSQSGSLEQ